MSAHGDVDLGHTVAGWTGTAIAFVGLSVLALAVVTVSLPLAVMGAAVGAFAGLTTWLLHLAGWGKPTGPRPASEWPWRVRDRAARQGHPDCLGCRMAGRRTSAATAPAPSGTTTSPAPAAVAP
ncbi:HGxxPAAW family protein [Streptomyces sp. NPDC047971]|uniref:HGxxPAAW family protein n=1 Tax=Streptomyces sp. NPDC047971 TaxID=3154499 RepID=UPI0033C88E5E